MVSQGQCVMGAIAELPNEARVLQGAGDAGALAFRLHVEAEVPSLWVDLPILQFA